MRCVVLPLCHSTHSMDKNFPSNLGPRGRMDTRRNYFAAAAEISRRGAVVIVQHSAQPLAAQHCSRMTRLAFIWHDQPVAETLVVSLAVIVRREFVDRLPQRAFTEEDHPVQAGFLDGSNKALRLGIGVRSQLHPMST